MKKYKVASPQREVIFLCIYSVILFVYFVFFNIFEVVKRFILFISPASREITFRKQNDVFIAKKENKLTPEESKAQKKYRQLLLYLC